MVGQGVKARASYWWRADGRFRQRQEIEGLGVLESGFDGEAVWSQDPIFGMRELKGLEAAQATWLASPLSWASYETFVTDAQIKGKVTVAGGDDGGGALSVREGVKTTARFLDADGRLAGCPLVESRGCAARHVCLSGLSPGGGVRDAARAGAAVSVTGDIHESYSAVSRAHQRDARFMRVTSGDGGRVARARRVGPR